MFSAYIIEEEKEKNYDPGVSIYIYVGVHGHALLLSHHMIVVIAIYLCVFFHDYCLCCLV